jgi:hypothetical protein
MNCSVVRSQSTDALAANPAGLKGVTTMKQAAIRVVLFWTVPYISAFLNFNSNIILSFPVHFLHGQTSGPVSLLTLSKTFEFKQQN